MESSPDSLTPETQFFLEPASSARRQYEALRAYFVEGASSADVSRRFGYTPGSFRVLCHHFRRSKPDFFRELKHGPHTQPKKDAVRELILGMRKQNLSIYDIESALKTQQTPLSTTAIWEILHEEGFARLPRRQDAERPATLHPTAAAIADCREFSLAPRRFSTQLGGLFLFLPLLVDCDLPGLVRQAGDPGSKMIPAPQAWLSLLGLKLSSTERKSHVMDLVFDEGLALFAGLRCRQVCSGDVLQSGGSSAVSAVDKIRGSPARQPSSMLAREHAAQFGMDRCVEGGVRQQNSAYAGCF